MKTKLILGALLVAQLASAQTEYWTGTHSGGLIGDNDPNGWATTFHVSGTVGVVTNVAVTLDISGGFNGDLYAYLIDPSGTMAVLLNRVGVGGANSYGYSDSGFQITLSSVGGLANIHNVTTGSGLTAGGIYAADGRNIDPLSLPGVFDSASALQGLNAFYGAFPVNGDWTFFIADLGQGQSSTLNSVMLTIMTPEPQTWAIMGGGLAVLWIFRRR